MTTRGMVITFIVLFILLFGSIISYQLEMPYDNAPASPIERWLIVCIVGGLISAIGACFFTGAIAAAFGAFSGPDIEGRSSSDLPPFGGE
ncbi:MAG TPA: hypothetical protein PKL84_11760 [Candidatus Hydrogenedentes bacterium]|nr:hypothetical protein [Candidatus Hydrogenedentota bacterium]